MSAASSSVCRGSSLPAPPPLPPRRTRRVISARRPSARDWQEWAELRGESRGFLTPWEPSWSADALTRAAFRRRLARYAVDWRTDQGYSFFLFRREDDALLGGIGLSNVRRGVAETGSLGYWIGERYARQGYMTEGLRPGARLRLRAPAAAPRRGGLPAAQRGRAAACCSRPASARKATRGNISASTASWQDHVLFAMLRDEWLGEDRR